MNAPMRSIGEAVPTPDELNQERLSRQPTKVSRSPSSCPRTRYPLLPCLALLVAGCTALRQPGLSEEDKSVVFTPKYAENHVFYICGHPSAGNPGLVLKNAFELVDPNGKPSAECDFDKFAFRAGDHVAVLLSAVRLPSSINLDLGSNYTRDVAVILDIYADSDGTGKSLVVWYQRGVTAGQTLNFSNLLIYQLNNWDNRRPPLFRIRVMDVAAEKNAETRALLANVQQYSSNVSALLTNPFAGPAVNMATRAATLVFANRQNVMLVDYTLQFYPDSIANMLPGTSLAPFRQGTFVLLGRPPQVQSSYWRESAFCFDAATQEVLVRTRRANCAADALSTYRELPAPYVQIAALSSDMIVSSLVAERSAFLQKLLATAAAADLDALAADTKSLSTSLQVFAATQRVYRSRDPADLKDAVALLKNADTPPDQKAALYRFLEDMSADDNGVLCTIDSPAKAEAFAKANAGLRFDKKSSRLQLPKDKRKCQ